MNLLLHQKRNVILLFVGVLIPLFAFGLLAEDVLEKEVFKFDGPVLNYLHAHANPVLDAIMVWSTRAGSAFALVPLIIVVAVYLYRKREPALLRFWVLATCGAALLNVLAKHSFARKRPDLWVSMLPETTYSFPSGHAMESMAVVAAIVCLLWHRSEWRWIALGLGSVFVLLVGVSRIYLGVHYPSDVLAGWLASFAWAIGLAVVTKAI